MNGANLKDLSLLVAGVDSGRRGAGAHPGGAADIESALGHGGTVLAALWRRWRASGSGPAT